MPQRKVFPKEKNKLSEIKAVNLEKPKDELRRGATLVQTAFNVTETALEKEKAQSKIRQRSFAPLNFQFQPMNGIPAFKFNAMTFRSTNAFLSPGYIWSPAKVLTVSEKDYPSSSTTDL